MHLLTSTDFALRVLMRLGTEPGPGPVSVEALSRDLGGLSRNHLHKIVQELAVLGVVQTVRGAKGGVRLAVEPGKIRVGSLVRQLEADQPIVECFRPDQGCCTLLVGCCLRGFLREAREDFYRSLDRWTMDDCLPVAPARLGATPP